MKVLIIVTLAVISIANSLKINPSPRIIGGKVATVQDFPFSAAIYKHTAEGSYFCGGLILSQKWILTAGQCVEKATLFTIQLGSISLKDADSNRQTVSTSSYVLHEDYNPATLENDLGLIELRLPIVFNEYIKPIDRLPLSSLPDFVTVTAIGWGATSDLVSGPVDKLHYAHVISVTNEECALTYGEQIKDTMICVAGNNNEGSCQGDVGSPIIQYYSTGHVTIVGIASFHSGNGCETPDPSGYSRIYMYNSWIKEKTGLFQ